MEKTICDTFSLSLASEIFINQRRNETTNESHWCEKHFVDLLFERYAKTQRYIIVIDWLVYNRFNPAVFVRFVYASRLSKRHIQLVAATSKVN